MSFRNWTIERAQRVLRRAGELERAGNITIESIDHAANALHAARGHVARLADARERLQARAGDFQAANERLDQLMTAKRDELVASAREGREPDYREIDAQLADVRAVLANYRDEQVNVPAALAELDRQLTEARDTERLTLEAAHDFMDRHYGRAFADARDELMKFVEGPLRMKLERVWAMYQVQRAYSERSAGGRVASPGTPERTVTTEGEMDALLAAFEALGGVALRDAEVSKIATEHVDEMQRRGIGTRFGYGAPAREEAPNPIQIHIAKQVIAQHETEANQGAVQVDDATYDTRAKRLDALHEQRMNEVVMGEGAL
ncbi:hypothetical protein QZM52_07380 [Burkholderia metallica]|uniref:Uncharacterized protein n=1 Tax=Burkholderia metallica TaxID=488729 RepID=A0ABT8P7Q5_9BURK|nr:hypothetical protein [Burkholderia metallica]MDN7931114.1 hypothetical protein [Burkholderia metallica]